DDLLHERLLLLLRDGAGLLLEGRRPVLGVCGHGRQLDVDFLRDRARPRDVGGDLRDPLDFVLADDRAAREAPDAAVNHADAQAARAGTPARAGAPTAAATASAAAAAESAEAARVRACGSIVGSVGVDRRAHAAREADVGIRTARALGLAERDVREALERRG